MIRLAFFAVALIATAALFSGGGLAHQQKAALTEILLNARTGNIEIAHRFYMHDAEHAVRLKVDPDGDLYASPETRAAFAAYVAERFTLATPDGARLQLTLLGTEMEGGYLWVYQETPTPEGLEALVVRHDALRDVWPDQVNRVNVRRGDTVRTLVFSGAAKELVARLRD